MKRRVNPTASFKQQYIVQVPRKRPKGDNVYIDAKKRTWIKASDYPTTTFTQWETSDNRYYVWFNAQNAPDENEVVFGTFRIKELWRFRDLLRAVVLLEAI